MKKKNPTKITYPFTHPNRILYPEQNITKLQLAQYYEQIQQWILPYIINRPLTLVRCPSNYKKCFYQKHLADKLIPDIYTIDIKEKHTKGKYIYIKNLKGLLALVQLGVLEIHPWGCTIKHIEKPDMMTFDLDPAPDVAWKNVIAAAKLIKKEFKKIGLDSFVKTTGGKGLHVVIPIKPHHDWHTIRTFTHSFVKYMVSQKPLLFTDNMSKAKRVGKIFIDYLRNQRGATAVAAFSTRAKQNASVSTPLEWRELSTKIKSDTFDIFNLPKRLAKSKKDPWEDFFRISQSLPI